MAVRQHPEGYLVPVYKSLTEPILLAGAPRDLVIFNLMLGASIGFIMRLYPIILLNFVLHFIAVIATKKDPQFFAVVKRHLEHKIKGIYLGT